MGGEEEGCLLKLEGSHLKFSFATWINHFSSEPWFPYLGHVNNTRYIIVVRVDKTDTVLIFEKLQVRSFLSKALVLLLCVILLDAPHTCSLESWYLRLPSVLSSEGPLKEVMLKLERWSGRQPC